MHSTYVQRNALAIDLILNGLGVCSFSHPSKLDETCSYLEKTTARSLAGSWLELFHASSSLQDVVESLRPVLVVDEYHCISLNFQAEMQKCDI